MQKYKDYYGQPKQVLKTWQAALYIRLSKEDMDKNKSESASISNQREILKEYLRLHPDIEHVDTYVDDGFSGTDFDRPDWTRLMNDIRCRKINCVIVKDLARLGRNYTASGDLIDNQFARLGVRFIALNNGIDTAGDGMNAATRCISIGVTNVINESYAASTSVNIRGTLNNHRKQGKFIGAFASYGYLKDPNDCHKLMIDEEAAPVVRMIFDEFISGNSMIGIVKKLNGMGIPNPTLYKQQKGFHFTSRTDNDGLWSDRTVRRILQNQMYIGNMVQGVNRTVNYKVHECRAVPKDEWIIVENTHEPIIDRETFDKAQSLFGRNIHSRKTDRKADLFAGFVYCADCGKAMHKKVNRQNGKTYRYYKCSTGGGGPDLSSNDGQYRAGVRRGDRQGKTKQPSAGNRLSPPHARSAEEREGKMPQNRRRPLPRLEKRRDHAGGIQAHPRQPERKDGKARWDDQKPRENL